MKIAAKKLGTTLNLKRSFSDVYLVLLEYSYTVTHLVISHDASEAYTSLPFGRHQLHKVKYIRALLRRDM